MFQRLISLLLIILFSPLWAVAFLLIKLESAGPVFFKQQRVGHDEKPFYIYKFRSMRLHSEKPLELGAIKHNHPLVTRTGYVLRRFKLDELPQLLNILRGEMSFIGPRPCLLERIPTMTVSERRRFNAKPGLTGWAEVNGNVELNWQEQLVLDLWYVDHRTLKLDWLIFFKTFYVVFAGSKKNLAALEQATNYLHH